MVSAGGDVGRDQVGASDGRGCATIVPLLRDRQHAAGADRETDRSMANSDRSASTGSPAAGRRRVAARRASPMATIAAITASTRSRGRTGSNCRGSGGSAGTHARGRRGAWIVDRFRHGVRFSGVAEPVSRAVGSGVLGTIVPMGPARRTVVDRARRAGQLPGPLPDPPGGVPCQFSAGVRRRWMIPRTTSTTIAAAATKATLAAMPAMRPIVDQANVESSRPRSVSP